MYNLVLLSDLQTQTSVQKENTTVKAVPYAMTLKDPLYVSAGSQGTSALIAQVKLYTLKFYILLIKYIKDVWSPLPSCIELCKTELTTGIQACIDHSCLRKLLYMYIIIFYSSIYLCCTIFYGQFLKRLHLSLHFMEYFTTFSVNLIKRPSVNGQNFYPKLLWFISNFALAKKACLLAFFL